MNYEGMSDFEINVEVAKALGVQLGHCAMESGCSVWGVDFELIDYCNNPSDAWPVIVENKINITYHSDGDACAEVFCESTNDWVSVVCKNPLRAAMICFLKMKNSEQ